jgi:SAM-dependent methyltransferase
MMRKTFTWRRFLGADLWLGAASAWTGVLPMPSEGTGWAGAMAAAERALAEDAAPEAAPMSAPDPYILGRSDAETRRLILQHKIYGPLTRRLFEDAGIGAGMTVLDVGSGAGDVALLLAELVGPRGRVVGVDTNAAILDTARARVQAAGWRNVTFHAGDVREIPLDVEFDAIAGRWILMHLPDPVAVLRVLATRLRPGGVMVFQESDFSYPPTMFPPSELSEQVSRWGIPPDGAAPGGPDIRMGTKLARAYLDAGLPVPELRLEAPIGAGSDWPGYEYIGECLRSMLPALQRATGLDPDVVGVDTLADRLREDAVTGGRVQLLPIIVGAWARQAA